jgi:hypothetical protein
MYVPGPLPHGASPEIREEFQRISQEMSAPIDSFRFNEVSVLPKKYGDGTTLFMSDALATALGLTGQGIYTYYGSAWNKLG